MDAYEAPSTIKGAGLGLFLGEEHLKKGDIIALYSGKWIARQADQHHRYTGKNPNVGDSGNKGMYNYRLRTGRGVEIMNGDTVGAPLTYTGIRSLATDRDSCDADRDLTPH